MKRSQSGNLKTEFDCLFERNWLKLMSPGEKIKIYQLDSKCNDKLNFQKAKIFTQKRSKQIVNSSVFQAN